MTNKQRWVLEYLREHGERTCKQIAQASPETEREYGPRSPRAGETYTFPSLSYSDVYVALEKLRREGFTDRRLIVDEWGDQTNKFVYFATDKRETTADELEAAFRAPSAEVDHE